MYTALYRKYRSSTFDELVGQKHITKTLKSQIINKEISHAYLFSGIRGTGKTSAAKIFSRGINCENPIDGNPCNSCKSCLSILNNTCMDVVEMDAASNNGVDDIRSLKEKVVYPPSEVRYKVYIIDEVHMLSKGAFNALLKILEEPPSHLVFILATTEPHKIPQTILSRTQRFNFKRISISDIENNLREIVEKEGKTCPDSIIELIASYSDGAMRDALSLLDQVLSFGDEVDEKLALEILSMTGTENILRLMESIIYMDFDSIFLEFDSIFSNGGDISILYEDLLHGFRNLMVCKEVENPGSLIYSSKIEKFIELSKKIDLSRILKSIEILNEDRNKLRIISDKRTLFEMSLVKLASVGESKEVVENSFSEPVIGKVVREEKVEPIIEPRKEIEEPIKTEPVKTMEEESSNNSSNNLGNTTLDNICSNWYNILQAIKEKGRINISALLKEAYPSNLNGGILTIGFDEKFTFHKNAVSTEENISFIENTLEELYGEKFKVEVGFVRDENKYRAISELENALGRENIKRMERK